MNAILAYLHYVALAIGFAGVFYRGRILREMATEKTITTKNLFLADNIWGIAALLWIVTGLMRVFGTYEKGSHYYLQSHWFWLKMILFLAIFILEIYPMVTFIKWRIAQKEQITSEDLSKIKTFVKLNHIEIILVLIIPFVASAMARGGVHW